LLDRDLDHPRLGRTAEKQGAQRHDGRVRKEASGKAYADSQPSTRARVNRRQDSGRRGRRATAATPRAG
ncbi:MAG TPA: hypothetical protein VKC16_04185, partial [Xanthobacteraceae bacterium]|nr:hypothetical protein [Xanthobacteraceae bacterium]